MEQEEIRVIADAVGKLSTALVDFEPLIDEAEEEFDEEWEGWLKALKDAMDKVEEANDLLYPLCKDEIQHRIEQDSE